MTAPGPTRGRTLPPLADRRGVTAAGAAVLAVVVSLAGALLDLATGNGLREAFAVAFVTGSVVAALTAHREDLKAVVVMPPLVYAAVAVTAGLLDRSGTGSVLSQQAIELANALILGAPVLLAGTLATAVVALARWAGGRG